MTFFNIDAAERLIKDNYYAPSVHCSYYSCFQLAKHTINYFFDVDYETQALNVSVLGQGTHQYVLNFISQELIKFAGAEESRIFKRTFKDLKQFRFESDYENIEISMEKGVKAFEKAKEIRIFLIKNFHV